MHPFYLAGDARNNLKEAEAEILANEEADREMLRFARQLLIDSDSDNDNDSNIDGGLYIHSRSGSGSDAGLYNWEERDPALAEDGADRAGPAQVERINRMSVGHSKSNSGSGVNEQTEQDHHGKHLN